MAELSETEEFGRHEVSPSRRKFARADFLRLASAGASLSVLPAYLAALGSASSAQTAVRGAGITGGEYPIGIWWPPPPSKTTVGRYKEIADAGFNFVVGGNGVNGHPDYPAALEAAEANGLRYLLSDGALQKIIRESAGNAASRTTTSETTGVMQYLTRRDEPISTFGTAATDPRTEINARIRDLVARYGQHPALAGLNIYDEPHKKMFGLVGYAKEVLQEAAPEEMPYVNVWPSYASPNALGTSTYEAYLERYFEVVRPPTLVFDHYPLLADGRITADYFYNWAVIRKYANRFGVPSQTFIQSVGFDGRKAGLTRRRKPNEQELLWQINVSLAYGAKGIQYFTYWTPDTRPGDPIKFGQALISNTGQRTALYYAAGRVNGYLRVIGKTLLPLVSESVVHAGEKNPPRGAKPFQKDAYVKSRSGSPVILSRFRDPAGGADRHMLVVNRSFSKRAVARLKLSSAVSRVFEISRTTGQPDPVALQGDPPRYLPVGLAPGAARLYVLQTG